MKRTLFVLLLALSSCVSTRITSFKDPNYSGPAFTKILVFAKYSSMETRVKFEHEFAVQLVEKKVWSDGAYVYLPPFRDYTDSEIVAMSNKKGIDAWLIITPGSSSFVTIHDYGNSESRKVVSGDELNSMGTQIVLCKAVSETPIYKGETQTQLYRYNGNTLASFDDVIRSAAANVADDLEADHLIHPTMKE